MSVPTCLITGANRGIGLSLVKLLSNTHKVFAACRNSSPELEALATSFPQKVTVVSGVDVSTAEGVAKLDRAVGHLKLSILVNNAGVLSVENLGDVSGPATSAAALDSVRMQFEVNAVAPLAVTAALREKLAAGSKVVIITSRMGSVADNSSGGFYGYRMSKAAVNMAGKSLAVDLKPDGIIVQVVHPGMVTTGMTTAHGWSGIEPDVSAKGIVERINEATIETTGRFFHMDGTELPW